MIATVRARFDDEVLRPEEPLDLKVDETYVVTVIAEGAIEQPADAELVCAARSSEPASG